MNHLDDETVFEEDDAGNMVVDMGAVDENAEYEVLPRGNYPVIVDNLTYDEAKSGNMMWVWVLEVEEGEYKGRKLYFHSVFTAKALPRLKKTLAAVAPDLLENKLNPEEIADEGTLLGVRATAVVKIGKYEGKRTNNVSELKAPMDSDDFMG